MERKAARTATRASPRRERRTAAICIRPLQTVNSFWSSLFSYRMRAGG